jgi:hypothetical protein
MSEFTTGSNPTSRLLIRVVKQECNDKASHVIDKVRKDDKCFNVVLISKRHKQNINCPCQLITTDYHPVTKQAEVACACERTFKVAERLEEWEDTDPLLS